MNVYNPSRRYAPVSWVLLALFCLRVIGQMLVASLNVTFLPPMEEWYSGLIPYPILLVLQWMIIIVLIKVCLDFSRGYGFFAVPKGALGRFLLWFSYLYFSSMVVRYGITMAFYPERRWFGGTLPIFFHFVLAGYLFTLGRFHDRHRGFTNFGSAT